MEVGVKSRPVLLGTPHPKRKVFLALHVPFHFQDSPPIPVPVCLFCVRISIQKLSLKHKDTTGASSAGSILRNHP